MRTDPRTPTTCPEHLFVLVHEHIAKDPHPIAARTRLGDRSVGRARS
jgi:hypothetical protein